MSNLDNAVVAAMIKAKEIGVKMLASDCDAILQAAIDSMQGEAVAYANPDDVDMNTYPDLEYDFQVTTKKYGEFTQPLYTHAVDSAARIAEQDALIKELEQQLEVARKDARRLVELVLVAREWYWVPCSQASDYVNHELFPRNQKFPGTDQNNNKTPMWNAIDTAIRQIGGAE